MTALLIHKIQSVWFRLVGRYGTLSHAVANYFAAGKGNLIATG
jgi:hypothetical protein